MPSCRQTAALIRSLTVSISGGTAWYVSGKIGISLLVYATMRDSRDHSRIETD